MKTYITDWNRSALNGVQTLDEISKKHSALCTTISELSKRALLQGVDLLTCGNLANLKKLADDIKMDAKRKLSNQGAIDKNLIASHSIGNSYLVDMSASFSDINLTGSNSDTDEITRSRYTEMEESC